jgi:cell wall-associated NlpC family hydrolase
MRDCSCCSSTRWWRSPLVSLRHNPRIWIAAGIALVVLAAAGVLAASELGGGGDEDTHRAKTVAVAPAPWSAAPGGERPAAYQPSVSERPKLAAKAAAAAADVDPVTGLPPASAGSNGSYEPPSPAERKRIEAATHPAGGADSAARTSLLLDQTALAPPSAPDPIKGAISAANLIVDQPYRWGGGHAAWRSRGYDCSGAVSYALAGGGLVDRPLTSGQFMSWGAPGPGQWLTIYANPGHVYAVIGGLRWDTVGDASGSGPRWHPLDAYPSGFTVRHLPGL